VSENENENNDNNSNLYCFTVGRRKSEPSVNRLRRVSSFHSDAFLQKIIIYL